MELTRVPVVQARRNAAGEVVAFAEAARIERYVLTGEPVELTVGRRATTVRLVRAGRRFNPYIDDEPYCYGYWLPYTASTTDNTEDDDQ